MTRSASKRSTDRRKRRQGAVSVEAAIVLSVFLLVLFGLLDLGLAALNSNNLKDVAQQVSRTAIVRGKNSGPQYSPWGPATYSSTAASGGEIATEAATALVIAPPTKVNILVEWPDGDSDRGSRVRTTLTYTHPMIVPGLFGISSIPMQAVSTMHISN